MTSREDRQIEKWSRTREMGMAKFILYFGVIGWGLATGLMWGIVMTFMDGFAVTDENIRTFLTGLVIFPIAGIFFGAIMWWWSERQYRKHQSQQ